jgi:hypothetical protein
MTDRRTTIKWIMAAAAAVPALRSPRARAYSVGLDPGANEPAGVERFVPTVHGYGPDPDLLKRYEKGAFWPLTLSAEQRQLAASLSDLIIPADEHSPSASSVGVVDFIDEWVSAPYPPQREDREIVLAGLLWIDGEARRRFHQAFAALDDHGQRAICDPICDASRARGELREAAHFFARYRDLTAGGFYTTPAGRADIQYIGNVPLKQFNGPPIELLKRLGLA